MFFVVIAAFIAVVAITRYSPAPAPRAPESYNTTNGGQSISSSGSGNQNSSSENSSANGVTTSLKPAEPALGPDDSIYKGKLKITSASTYNRDPLYENVYIRNDSDENINITDFKIYNSLGDNVIIPKAQTLPALYGGGNTDPIILKPKGRTVITFGQREDRINLQTNLCTGYLTQAGRYVPSIESSCPRVPEEEIPIQFTENCYNIIKSLNGSCSLPNYNNLSLSKEPECGNFLQNHFNYKSCVNNNRNRSDFYSGVWYVWLQRSTEFFRSSREKVILRDLQGKIVDEKSY